MFALADSQPTTPASWSSPKLERLREFFDDLSLGHASIEQIDALAERLHVDALMLAGFTERRCYRIVNGDAIAVRSPSLAVSLTRLKRAARSGSKKRWFAAWGGVAPVAHDAVVRHMGAEWRRRRDWPKDKIIIFANAGASYVAPRQEHCIEAIAKAIEELRTVPAAERQRRAADPQTAAFLSLARAIFEELTGDAASIRWDVYSEADVGAFLDMAVKINAIYGMSLPATRDGLLPRKRK